MAGSQVSTRSMVSELHEHLPYGQSCSNMSRRLSWAEDGSSYGNIFCVLTGFAKRPVLIIHHSSRLNEKGKHQKSPNTLYWSQTLKVSF